MAAPYAWTVLWPGLAQLWLRGQWSGLLVAVAFAAAVNVLLTTTFLWPGVIGSDGAALVFNSVGIVAVLCFWGASVVSTWRRLPRLQPGADARGDDALFLRAQTEYLRGHWYEAEKLLLGLLQDSPRDADAHLLLATLYRHTRRYDEAQARLTLLQGLEGAAKWLFEIDEERRRIAEAPAAETTSSDATDSRGETPQPGTASKAA